MPTFPTITSKVYKTAAPGDDNDNQEYDEFGRQYRYQESLDTKGDSGTFDEDDNRWAESSSKEDANLISSYCKDGMHRPVLDFDVPARLIPSSTPGHSHLYIDKPMTWEQYEHLLIVMVDAGILEPGYVGASINHSASHVRPPWVKKPGAPSTPPVKAPPLPPPVPQGDIASHTGQLAAGLAIIEPYLNGNKKSINLADDCVYAGYGTARTMPFAARQRMKELGWDETENASWRYIP